MTVLYYFYHIVLIKYHNVISRYDKVKKFQHIVILEYNKIILKKDVVRSNNNIRILIRVYR